MCSPNGHGGADMPASTCAFLSLHQRPIAAFVLNMYMLYLYWHSRIFALHVTAKPCNTYLSWAWKGMFLLTGTGFEIEIYIFKIRQSVWILNLGVGRKLSTAAFEDHKVILENSRERPKSLEIFLYWWLPSTSGGKREGRWHTNELPWESHLYPHMQGCKSFTSWSLLVPFQSGYNLKASLAPVLPNYVNVKFS